MSLCYQHRLLELVPTWLAAQTPSAALALFNEGDGYRLRETHDGGATWSPLPSPATD